MSNITKIFKPLVEHEDTLRKKGAFLTTVLKDFFQYDSEKYSNNWTSIEETTNGGYNLYAEIAEPLSTVKAGEFKPSMKLEISFLTGGVCLVDMSPLKPSKNETLELYTSAIIPFSAYATPEESAIEILGKLAVSDIDSSLQESLSSYLIDLKAKAKDYITEQNANVGYRVS